MRYDDVRSDNAVIAALRMKKRLGPRQKERLATLSARVEAAHQPPPTLRRAPTGARGDFQGNVYAQHGGRASTVREMRRGKRFGVNQCKPMRSRIQRTQRKQRTGGVK